MRNPVALQRLRHWQGQRLHSQDARDQAAIDDERRWWHNRAIHNAFGLVIGLQVSPGPKSDDRERVQVGQGLAYDCYGRELLLKEDTRIDLPGNLSDGWTLLIRYREDAEFPRHADASGLYQPPVCLPQPMVVLGWKRSDSVSLADGVPLARLEAETAEALAHPGAFSVSVRGRALVLLPERVLAHGLSRPFIRSGVTIAGRTPWQVWELPSDIGQRKRSGWENVTVQVTVDTSAANFTGAPLYFAWLQSGRTDEAFPLLVALNHIAQPSATSFVFRSVIVLPPIAPPGVTTTDGDLMDGRISRADAFIAAAPEFKLFVSWLGIQCDEAEREERNELA